MKTYKLISKKSHKIIIKCYQNHDNTKYFIKVENDEFTAKFEFTDKEKANKFFIQQVKML